MEFPAAGPVTLRDRLDVAGLVSYLRSSARTRPVAVLTIPPKAAAPLVSVASLDKEFGRAIDVVTLPSDDITWAFAESVGKASGVYHGACRVYPPGDAWEQTPERVPLFLVRSAQERSLLPQRLTMAVKAALAAPPPAPRPAAAPPPVAARPSNEPPPTPAPTPLDVAMPVPGPPRPRSTPGPPAEPGRGAPAVPLPPRIETQEHARQLAELLLSRARTHPVVVVTRAADAPSAYVNAEQLRENLEGLADVHEISTLEASWAFSHEVPQKCQVYGGASRVYPVGLEWTNDPYLSPLRFAYGTFDNAAVTRALTADAMSMASRGSVSLAAGPQQPHLVTGEVIGIVSERALVQLQGNGTGVLWPELVEPGLPAHRLFAKGMQIEGTLDPASRRIDVRGMRRTAEEALAAYRRGDTILGRVVDVREDGCTVELFPGYTCAIGAEYLTEDAADVRPMVATGDVLALWFAERDEASGEWLLSVIDSSDPDQAVPAPSILHGGPPWLMSHAASQRQAEELSEQAAAAPEADDEPTQGLTGELQREKGQLIRALREAENTIAELESALALSRRKLRQAERRRKRSGALMSDERLFDDDREQLDFEIRNAWARMTSPSEKRSLPLRNWSYGPDFFDTLHAIEGVTREKVVEVIVHVLTGRDAELASRELHQLRSGSGGDDPPKRRDGGETCWRVSLQVKTPGARRLHYWQCNDGSIELSSIRKHDDIRP